MPFTSELLGGFVLPALLVVCGGAAEQVKTLLPSLADMLKTVGLKQYASYPGFNMREDADIALMDVDSNGCES